MGHRLRTAAGLQFLALFPLAAQRSQSWKVRGDTTGAPAGCSASAGIAAMNLFVDAMRTADSTGLTRAVARRFSFSIGKFMPADTFVVAKTIPELLHYARTRARQHERLTIQAVTFNGWRGQGLQLGPIYILRTADDLGTGPRVGMGKGLYLCGQGIGALGLGPRPKLARGERMRADQAYPVP
jgi:hypothetical protein